MISAATGVCKLESLFWSVLMLLVSFEGSPIVRFLTAIVIFVTLTKGRGAPCSPGDSTIPADQSLSLLPKQ